MAAGQGRGVMETHRFKNDTITRKRLMVPESFSHPAKGQLGMWALMVERYSQPGDTVLDPMAGSGATLLAALMGRSVVCVELESHFGDPMRRSWEK
ncbi:MAG: DNA methyltransferase, partial [Candidatus Pacearchaeota archaeon]|nr:DNA methyltransferase [Candidatus Pacearchaeota archaeon]